MGKRKLTTAISALLMAAACLMPLNALADDTGLIISAGAEKKLNKQASISVEGEFRTRNDFRTADRLSLSLTGQYKLTSWLKADAGYQLLIDNNIQKLSLNPEGTYNNWRPSYWATRHRVFASLTASYKLQRVSFSLRERYRYTYRPQHTTTRYDFDNSWWEDTDVSAKHNHTLRSRLKIDWDIPSCKFDPWVSVELFNSLSLDKTRIQAGVDYSIKKKHAFEVFYRYQIINEDDEAANAHYLGLGYKFKF